LSPLQADEIFACLDRRQVRYVLIGGLAAVLQGSPLATYDVDICPARDPDNLRRLAEALEELGARIRTPGDADGVAFPREADFLSKVQVLNLVTRFGDFDISLQPSGTKGFEDLSRNSVAIRVRGIEINVATLQDIIRSKEAANRPKDRRSLPLLRQLLEEIRKRNL
jgi:hypothetical protein